MLKLKIPAKMHKSPSGSLFTLLVQSMGLLPFDFAHTGFFLLELLNPLALLLSKKISKPRRNHLPFSSLCPSSPPSSSLTPLYKLYYSLMSTGEMTPLVRSLKVPSIAGCIGFPTILNSSLLSLSSLIVAGSFWFHGRVSLLLPSEEKSRGVKNHYYNLMPMLITLCVFSYVLELRSLELNVLKLG